jgi:flotillin
MIIPIIVILIFLIFGIPMIFLDSPYYICSPSKVFVISGRKRRVQQNKIVGFRTIRGGRVIIIPIFEKVESMDLTNMIVEVRVTGLSKDFIPVKVEGFINCKISSEEQYLLDGVERLLGKSKSEIIKIIQNSCSGNLLRTISLIDANDIYDVNDREEDYDRFKKVVMNNSNEDLENLGIVLDSYKIQHVSDSIDYYSTLERMKKR